MSDAQRLTDVSPSPLTAGHRSLIIVPVLARGRVSGGLVAASFEPNAFDGRDLAAVTEVGSLLAAAGERAATRTAADVDTEQLSLALGQHAIGTWAWDPESGRFWLSAETEGMLGFAPGQFTGTADELAAALDDPSEPGSQQLRIRLNELTQLGVTELRYIDRAGTRRWIELRGRLADATQGDGPWVGIALDATDRNRLVADRIYLEQQADLARIAAAAAGEEAHRIDALLRQVVQDAPAGIGLWDAELRCIVLNHMLASILDTEITDARGKPFREHSPAATALHEAFSAVLETGLPVDQFEVPGLSASTASTIWSFRIFPTRTRGLVTGVGVVAIDMTEQRRARRIEDLLHLASDIASEQHGELEANIADLARLPLPDFGDCAIVAFRDATTDGARVLEVHAGESTARETFDRTGAALASDLLTLTAETDRARFLTDVERAGLRPSIDLADGMIVTIGDEHARAAFVIGVRAGSAQRYSSRDLQLASELAYRIVDVLENAALRSAADLARSRLELLARVGELTARDIGRSADLRTLIDIFVPDFADAALFLLVDGDVIRGGPAYASDPGHQSWLEAQWSPTMPLIADSPATNSLRTRTSILFTRNEMERYPDQFAPDLHETAARLGMETGLTIPIIGADGPIGALFLGRTSTRVPFDADDLELAPEIARRVVPVIEAGQRLRRAQQQTEALQRSLLPRELPTVFGYTLAAQYRAAESELRVGGDWYDVLTLPDRTLLFAIGDVTGHGAFAAGLTGQLRTALRIAVLETTDVAVLLDRLNRFLNGLPGFEMGTAALVHLDQDSGHMTWASAGHPAPLVRRADGSTLFIDHHGGPPLGAMDLVEYRRHDNHLGPGDCIIMYTDGLVERRDEPIDRGFDRLAGFVRANAPDECGLDTCATGLVEAMTADYTPEDDLALLIAHRTVDVNEIAFTIPADPDGIRDARRRVADHLRRGHAPDAVVQDLTLVASELCANAMEHGGDETDSEMNIRCATSGRGAELAVEDTGTWVTTGPRRGGRGLQIVRALTDSMDVSRTEPGTRVTVRRAYEPVTS